MRVCFELRFTLLTWNTEIIICNSRCMVNNLKLLFLIFTWVTKSFLYNFSNWSSNKIPTWCFTTKLRPCNFNQLWSNFLLFLFNISPLIVIFILVNFKFLPGLFRFTSWPFRFIVTFTFRCINSFNLFLYRFLFFFWLVLNNWLWICRLWCFQRGSSSIRW